MGTGNLKWLQASINSKLVTIEVPYGLNKAQFKAEDFSIKNCNRINIDKIPMSLLL